MMKIQPSDRQGGKIRPACLSLYYTTLSIRIFITVNRTSVIKAVSSFTGFPLYERIFPYLHIRFRAADLIFVAKVHAMPFLSARSCRTVPGKISMSSFAGIVFGRETLHKEPCHLVERHIIKSVPEVAMLRKGKQHLLTKTMTI